MRRAWIAGHSRAALLVLAAAAAGEEWAPLWEQWKAALKRYEAALEKAPNDEVRARIRHPYEQFRSRLRDFAIENAGFPKAAPALIEMIRSSRDAEEQVWIMLQLRESHLRSKYLYRAVPALVRIEGKESLRTLREIAEGSPHERCKRAARLGVHERTKLAIGKPAPNVVGKDKRGKRLELKQLLGKPLLLVLGDAGRTMELRSLGIRIAGVGNEWPGFAGDEAILERFNAQGKPRIFVLDANGVIRGKDLSRKELAALVKSLQPK